MLTLPTELDTADRSLRLTLICGQFAPGTRLGESSIMELTDALREGMPIPFWVMMGEESGDDCSARVEWWRLVHAREKSRPREWRGSDVWGEAYDVNGSSCGDNGALCALPGAAIDIVRGGSCSDRPRERKSGRLGVWGDGEGTVISSLGVLMVELSRLSGSEASRKAGDGASIDIDPLLRGGLDGVLSIVCGMASIVGSINQFPGKGAASIFLSLHGAYMDYYSIHGLDPEHRA